MHKIYEQASINLSVCGFFDEPVAGLIVSEMNDLKGKFVFLKHRENIVYCSTCFAHYSFYRINGCTKKERQNIKFIYSYLQKLKIKYNNNIGSINGI